MLNFLLHLKQDTTSQSLVHLSFDLNEDFIIFLTQSFIIIINTIIFIQEQETMNNLSNFHNFIVLCEKHGNISFKSGLHPLCEGYSAMCRHQCGIQPHIQSKHQYKPIKQLIRELQLIKSKYQSFKEQVTTKYMPLFLQKLKNSIMKVEQEILKSMTKDSSIFTSFCQANANQSELIRDFLQQIPQQWNLSEYTCKQIYCLINGIKKIENCNIQDWSERINYYLTSSLQLMLSKLELLPNLKSNNSQKQNNMIFIKAQDLIDANKQLQFKIKDFNVKLQTKNKNVSKIVLQLQDKSIGDYMKKQNNFVTQNILIEKMFKNLDEYIKKVKPQFVSIFIKIALNRNNFWQRIIGLASKNSQLKLVEVFTSEGIENDYYLKQLKLYYNNLPLKIHPNTNWVDSIQIS